ncbi:MAG TPA: LysR family transcriptional regulator, partial [Planctomycetota bacterium]|nr:LysR family transcriptional regulator [Planctomycetota bacterium]
MNLETLRLYTDIVRLKSFSRGAKANGITQSAASQAIQQLEEGLGLQLIDRRRRPFALTPAGERYYEGLRNLLSEYTKLEAEIKQPGSGMGGTVRVAAIYSVGLRDMSQYVQRFVAQQPGVQIDLEYLHPDRVTEKVLDGTAD